MFKSVLLSLSNLTATTTSITAYTMAELRIATLNRFLKIAGRGDQFVKWCAHLLVASVYN